MMTQRPSLNEGAPRVHRGFGDGANRGAWPPRTDWKSPPGNLYVSLLVRPPRPASRGKSAFSCRCACTRRCLGRIRAVRHVSIISGRTMFKWMDVRLLDCLLESSGGSQDNVEWVVIGCGVNIAFHPNLDEYDTISLNSVTDEKTSIDEFLVFAGTFRGPVRYLD